MAAAGDLESVSYGQLSQPQLISPPPPPPSPCSPPPASQRSSSPPPSASSCPPPPPRPPRAGSWTACLSKLPCSGPSAGSGRGPGWLGCWDTRPRNRSVNEITRKHNIRKIIIDNLADSPSLYLNAMPFYNGGFSEYCEYFREILLTPLCRTLS